MNKHRLQELLSSTFKPPPKLAEVGTQICLPRKVVVEHGIRVEKLEEYAMNPRRYNLKTMQMLNAIEDRISHFESQFEQVGGLLSGLQTEKAKVDAEIRIVEMPNIYKLYENAFKRLPQEVLQGYSLLYEIDRRSTIGTMSLIWSLTTMIAAEFQIMDPQTPFQIPAVLIFNVSDTIFRSTTFVQLFYYTHHVRLHALYLIVLYSSLTYFKFLHFMYRTEQFAVNRSFVTFSTSAFVLTWTSLFSQVPIIFFLQQGLDMPVDSFMIIEQSFRIGWGLFWAFWDLQFGGDYWANIFDITAISTALLSLIGCALSKPTVLKMPRSSFVPEFIRANEFSVCFFSLFAGLFLFTAIAGILLAAFYSWISCFRVSFLVAFLVELYFALWFLSGTAKLRHQPELNLVEDDETLQSIPVLPSSVRSTFESVESGIRSPSPSRSPGRGRGILKNQMKKRDRRSL